MLDEKNEEPGEPAGGAVCADETPHCPPPRWATGLRRVLYPDVTMDDEAEIPEPPSGS